MRKVSNSQSNEYVRVYEGMGGIGKGRDEAEKRYAYTENMYADRHSDDGAIESVPGFRKLHSFGERINAIHKWTLGDGKQFIFVHAGSSLYSFEKDEYENIGEREAIASLSDKESSAVAFERLFYIFDGEKITVINEDGNATQITASSSENLYTPLCYTNTSSYEPRNLLSKYFKESYSISSAAEMSYGTPELIYSVCDEENMYCSVVGIKSGYRGDVYIPSNVKIGGKSYKVVEIKSYAFMYNQSITSVTVSDGVERIGKFAFWGSNALKSAVIGQTVSSIGNSAFYSCGSLEYFYMGLGVREIGNMIFEDCNSLSEINYAGNTQTFIEISNSQAIGSRSIIYESQHESLAVAVPIISDAKEISEVLIDGMPYNFEFNKDASAVVIMLVKKSEIEGRLVEIFGTLNDSADSFPAPNGGERVSAIEAILGCTVCEVFDGRMFISGNPSLPGTVFYSHTTNNGESIPLYFGRDAHFTDGSGDHNVLSLVSTGAALTVFKAGDDGSGSIFYHRAEGSYESRYYPLSYVHGRVCAAGKAYAFLNDALFISRLGLTRLKRAGTDYRTTVSESERINHLLLKENGADIIFAEWLGYLVLSVGDKMFLADAQKRMLSGKNEEYEWYYLSGIGSYENDTRVYRYSEKILEGYAPAESPGEMTTKTVHSTTDEDGNPIYYVYDNRKHILVEPTDEYTGGTFYPVCALMSFDELLFFGTECGDLCVFNNDKIGKFPDGAADDSAWCENRLYKGYYSFAGHAVRYAIKTVPDDCGASYLEKSTVPASLIIKAKNLDGGAFRCEVITDSEGVRSFGVCPSKSIAFDDLDFGAFSSTASDKLTALVNDRSRDFFEKQIALYSDGYASPFGVYSISYRYKTKDTVKKSNM